MELNKVFEIKKGKRSSLWKIVKHPYIDGAFALVRDHQYLVSGKMDSYDEKHIVSGHMTIEAAVIDAFEST